MPGQTLLLHIMTGVIGQSPPFKAGASGLALPLS
jgi:hypothetical protein